MLQKIGQKMDELNMVSPGDVILAGVSGGADSVCLLLLLKELAKERDFTLEAVHVEHGIRGEESKQDASFVEELCSKYQIVCHSVSVDVPSFSQESGMGMEEAARALRYNVFSQLAKERNAKIALAHHMEDNAETILFQMVRGSSLTGLCGMQSIRKDEDGVKYIRPLLTARRYEIETYLKERGQEYCIDSTNQELNYSRNYLRNVILPELVKINEQAVSHINMTAASLSDVRDYLELETNRHWEYIVEKSADKILLNVKELLVLHPAMQKEIAYKAISEAAGGKKDISAVHVSDLLGLCNNRSGKELHLPNGVVAKKEYDNVKLFVSEKQEENSESETVFWVSEEMLETCYKEGSTLSVPLKQGAETLLIRVFSNENKTSQIPKKTYTKWLDYDKIKKGFCIRKRNSGDYLISDVFGHHKKLKQYFIDEKIPVTQRNDMWLLAQEDLVLWLLGGRISEHVKVEDDTQTIIEIKYEGGNDRECGKWTEY